MRFVNVTEVQVKAQVAQFVRLEACKEVITEREAKGGWKFDWVIRTRPDLFFYAGSMGHDGGRVADGAVPRPSGSSRGGRLPLLSTLDTGAVHARMRCYGFPNASFTEQHISADNHHVLRRACGSRPTECDCTRIQPGCPPNAVRVDDSFAIVPRALVRSYFRPFELLTDGCPLLRQGRRSSLVARTTHCADAELHPACLFRLRAMVDGVGTTHTTCDGQTLHAPSTARLCNASAQAARRAPGITPSSYVCL